MKYLQVTIVTSMFILLCVPAIVLAAETCSMLGGTCKQACAPNETAESGAFLDCEESQKCCVKEEAALKARKAPSVISGPLHRFLTVLNTRLMSRTGIL